MIGLACSALAYGTAYLVTRREPRHSDVRHALEMSMLYTICVECDGYVRAPRATLLVWCLVAIASSWAYLKAWAWNPMWTLISATCCLMAWGLSFAPNGPHANATGWTLATWGPFVWSSLIGIGALWHWRKDNRPKRVRVDGIWTQRWPPTFRHPTIVQRIALILLVSDVCMLLFIPWPTAQVWQGRASAIVVALIQGMWLIDRRTNG